MLVVPRAAAERRPAHRAAGPPKRRSACLRTEIGAAFAGGKLYVIAGGSPMAESSTLVQEYDPKTDRWRDRAPLPMALSHVGVAALNGKVYVVGGFLKNVHLYAQPYAFEYDPAKNTWRTLPWMKAARGSVGVVALGGKLHAIGGRGIDRSHRRYA